MCIGVKWSMESLKTDVRWEKRREEGVFGGT